MCRRLVLAGAALCAVVAPVPARGQSAGSSIGDVTSGVYRNETRGTVPVEFELRGRGSEPIAVTAETDDARYASFTPACATPCTLWFERGRHFVELGASPLRERVLQLDLDGAAMHVRFSRDDPVGVVAGVIIAGAGVVAMAIGIPLAATSSDSGPFWGVAGGGVVLFGVGAALTFTAFGGHQIAPASTRR
jgi:hypothetical protein